MAVRASARVRKWLRYTHAFFSRLCQDSIPALSQPWPCRLLLAVRPSRANRAW